MKGKVSAKRVLCFFFSFFRGSWCKASVWSLWTSRHCCRNSSEKLRHAFLQSIKRRRLEVTFFQHDFKCNVQGQHFVYFYEVIINCYPNFITCFYFPPTLVRSNRSHCQLMELFKSKSFKENIDSDNNWKAEQFYNGTYFLRISSEFLRKCLSFVASHLKF